MNVLDCQWKRNASLQYTTFWTTWYPQMAIIKINDFRSKLNTVIDRVWIRYILDYQEPTVWNQYLRLGQTKMISDISTQFYFDHQSCICTSKMYTMQRMTQLINLYWHSFVFYCKNFIYLSQDFVSFFLFLLLFQFFFGKWLSFIYNNFYSNMITK